MKADVRSPPFHPWQFGDKVDKYLVLCVLFPILFDLVDFIHGRIPGNDQQKSIVQNYASLKVFILNNNNYQI